MKKVPGSTVGRLSLYLRLLDEVVLEGTETLSSTALALRAGTTAAQVRKDLSFFGTFGKRGLGYSVSQLGTALRSILGLEKRWRVAVIGAGKIGRALLGYEDFKRQGFEIQAVFDTDAEKIGQEWHGLSIQPAAQLEQVLGQGYHIAIIAVPGDAAQAVLDRVVEAGVRAILNFAPVKLHVPEGVTLKNVNMALELEGLSFALSHSALNAASRA